jgi:hypothetical protein
MLSNTTHPSASSVSRKLGDWDEEDDYLIDLLEFINRTKQEVKTNDQR